MNRGRDTPKKKRPDSDAPPSNRYNIAAMSRRETWALQNDPGNPYSHAAACACETQPETVCTGSEEKTIAVRTRSIIFSMEGSSPGMEIAMYGAGATP